MLEMFETTSPSVDASFQARLIEKVKGDVDENLRKQLIGDWPEVEYVQKPASGDVHIVLDHPTIGTYEVWGSPEQIARIEALAPAKQVEFIDALEKIRKERGRV